MKYDHYESHTEWLLVLLWTLILCLCICFGILGYKYKKLESRMDTMEMYQGPQMPTEWTVVNGKVVLYQSPYYVQVTP